MRPSHLPLALGAVLALGVLASTEGFGFSTEPSSPLSGHWRAAETEDEKERRLEAIEQATDKMDRFRRGSARSRLTERTSPQPTLTIELEGSKVTIASGERRIELELGGSTVEVSGRDGEAQMSAKMDGERLVVVARGENGERTTTYRADGTRLSLEVTMRTERLAGPLSYAATYVR